MAHMGVKFPIPSELDPANLRDILAKSQDNGGDTLAEHTWAVLSRLADQRRLRPHLPSTIGDDRLWHRLYWGCFLHDFGKAARQFQERLRAPNTENDWSRERHRHEVLSLAFVDHVFPSGNPDRLPVIAIVVSHHRDWAGGDRPDRLINPRYGGHSPDLHQDRRTEFLSDQLAATVTIRLWEWFNTLGTAWARVLGFSESEVGSVTVSPIPVTAQHIRRCLSDFASYYVDREDDLVDRAAIIRDLHYRGLILTADHAASAGADPFPPLQLTIDQARRKLDERGEQLKTHQEAMMTADEGSAILVAPTGSGKTEAALMWTSRQLALRPTSRLFYTLPYQASMNAMTLRLQNDFFAHMPDQVTVQHSRALLAYFRAFMESDGGASARQAVVSAKGRKNLVRLNYFPVQVFSPYQMLKAAFQLRGYEPLLVDYTDALFIFDEIHAYDPSRLALIITLIGWLAERFRARFLIMTATLPPMVKDKLEIALSRPAAIKASTETFLASQRHRVHLRDTDLLNDLDRPFADWREGCSVLICCNTVKRAQQAYLELKTRFTAAGLDSRNHLLLLHGRFNGKDRRDKEALLAQRVGVRAQHRHPMVIVATQVVEVSLDIDLDVLYTDPAPLEALLQRFGRINRGRYYPKEMPLDQKLCPVFVYKQPLGEKESRPYDFRIIERSLAVLEQHYADRPIDESQVTMMLGEMYQGTLLADWERIYEGQARTFKASLDTIVPYQATDPELEKQFYELFDGVEVLPKDSYTDWETAADREGYLSASQYLVSISWSQLGRLKRETPVVKEENQYFYQVSVPYNEEFGLDLNKQLGGDDDA